MSDFKLIELVLYIYYMCVLGILKKTIGTFFTHSTLNLTNTTNTS
jgi:hypothetical protein